MTAHQGDREISVTDEFGVWADQFHDIPLNKPADDVLPDGKTVTYWPGDGTVGDLDGDGEYELVFLWNPSISKDNSQSGYTGKVYAEAVKFDGTSLWRIDLGVNIRAGAHYTQLEVFDFDGDGRSEVAFKTADGTVDGVGTVIGNPSADYRNSSGYILSGPEYLTVFDGQTGAAIDTVDYKPGRGSVSAWGDAYGNRVDRFLAGVAYLDGEHPSLVVSRGYYTRTVIVAWDLVDGELVERWTFDSNVAGNDLRGPGQPPVRARRRRPRRTRRDRVRLDDHRRRRHAALQHAPPARRRAARRATSSPTVPASRCTRCTRAPPATAASSRRCATPRPAR